MDFDETPNRKPQSLEEAIKNIREYLRKDHESNRTEQDNIERLRPVFLRFDFRSDLSIETFYDLAIVLFKGPLRGHFSLRLF